MASLLRLVNRTYACEGDTRFKNSTAWRASSSVRSRRNIASPATADMRLLDGKKCMLSIINYLTACMSCPLVIACLRPSFSSMTCMGIMESMPFVRQMLLFRFSMYGLHTNKHITNNTTMPNIIITKSIVNT